MFNKTTILRFKKGYRLHYDNLRQIWFIQAPEKAFYINDTSVAILRYIDGKHNISDIIEQLSQKFDVSRTILSRDITHLLSDLRQKKILTISHVS